MKLDEYYPDTTFIRRCVMRDKYNNNVCKAYHGTYGKYRLLRLITFGRWPSYGKN